jgi:hypothetical protein
LNISRKGAQGLKVVQGESKRRQGPPKASQSGPTAAARRDKRIPPASQMVRKESHGTLKGVQRKPIYTKTPHQPHHWRLKNHLCVRSIRPFDPSVRSVHPMWLSDRGPGSSANGPHGPTKTNNTHVKHGITYTKQQKNVIAHKVNM